MEPGTAASRLEPRTAASRLEPSTASSRVEPVTDASKLEPGTTASRLEPGTILSGNLGSLPQGWNLKAGTRGLDTTTTTTTMSILYNVHTYLLCFQRCVCTHCQVLLTKIQTTTRIWLKKGISYFRSCHEEYSILRNGP